MQLNELSLDSLDCPSVGGDNRGASGAIACPKGTQPVWVPVSDRGSAAC
jgi:hypothetical protein